MAAYRHDAADEGCYQKVGTLSQRHPPQIKKAAAGVEIASNVSANMIFVMTLLLRRRYHK